MTETMESHLTGRDGRVFELHGVTFTSFAASASGARSLAAWRADFSPCTPGSPHTMSTEEVLHVLSGALEIEVGDQHFVAVAGEAVLVPAGARFRVSNASAEPASAWVTTPLGMRATMIEGAEQLAPPWAQ